ncbi:hypothetical protein BJX61DRAFT_126342 [Aspergillus egyptiacus]|nr:hypothetical protein BJX61DRAFT_126342 [Aspergillus egyptiacus]
MGTSSVRRNLFHNHLSRRAASTSGAESASSGLSSQVLQSSAPESNSALPAPVDDGEIVVKDKNGGYKLDIPVLPPLEGENGDDMEGIEGGGSTAATGADSTEQEMNVREKEKMEANLAELIYRNRNRRMSNEQHEILALLHQCLRNKVAAMDEENWMFEGEADSCV